MPFSLGTASQCQPDPPAWLAEHGIALRDDGRIRVMPAPPPHHRLPADSDVLPYQTANAKVFADDGGVRGAELVVTAVQEGRDAAGSIVRFLAVD